MTPWGQPLFKHFTVEQWEMVNSLASLSDETIEHTIERIVQEYFENLFKGFEG